MTKYEPSPTNIDNSAALAGAFFLAYMACKIGPNVPAAIPDIPIHIMSLICFGGCKTSKNDNAGDATASFAGGANPDLMTGYVEASNVDLAKEFSDMITTHRGFQSNTKMITVSDEMLSDLVAMKR